MIILKLIKKLFYFAIVAGFLIFILSRGHVYKPKDINYGLTFSHKQAEELNLDWQQTFLDILNELKVKKLRLPAYWDEIEEKNSKYNWQDLDWQITQASKENVEIILAVGGRLPRWPECHFPEWAQNIEKEKREERILKYIEAVINRYKNNKNIIAWQIENEPFLSHFGKCPKFDKKFLEKEIKLARSLDDRDIVVTDSGELSIWVGAAKRADIFGTTMYRDTYSQFLGKYVHYPITPGFFRLKKNIARIFAQPDKWIVIELQAEPWGPKPYQDLSEEEKSKTMNLQKFKEMISFSSKTGFQEFYLWGVEWWYWEKENNNNPDLWEYAKTLF